MKPAIEVHGISKQFRLGGRPSGYRTVRESVMHGLGRSWGAFRRRDTADSPADDQTLFWALKDVTLEIQPGEVVGIIGRNGSGKSTLLKVLSRIYEPTNGRAIVRGRLASLLEVGTGFHPELTGRENIYLNGSILGMTRREIARQFDEIVAFSEIEQFLDTPVKRYSSGMYVRLAFAIAAHVEPEILIVDEILAVGDATYQRRCLSRMEEIVREGRTVLFVSHNHDLIPRLCRTAVQLEKGRVQEIGPAKQVTDRYHAELMDAESGGDLNSVYRTGDGRARFTRVSINGGGPHHRSGDDLIVTFTVNAQMTLDNVALTVNLRSLSGTRIYSAWTREQGIPVRLDAGLQTFSCTFRRVCFRPGVTFEVELWMESGEPLDHVPSAARVVVSDGENTGNYSNNPDQGLVLTRVDWQV